MEVVVLRYRATFILLLVYTLFARPSFSSAFDLANYSRAPQSPFNSRLQTTERAPEACNCAQVRSRKVGVCHFYTDEASGSCGSRPCRKSYQCTSMITGLTCMRRRTVKKIVPLPQSPYSCKTVRTNGIMYVPYANRPLPKRQPRRQSQASFRRLPGFKTLASNRRPPQTKPRARNRRTSLPRRRSSKRKLRKIKKKRKRFFMVIAGESVLGAYPKLSVAKKILGRFSPRSKRRRAIFEVRNGKVGKDPRRVGGRRNQGGGMKNGFNKFWWNKNDVNAMYKSAVGYLMARSFKKGKPEYYIVVAGKLVLGETRSLREAKKMLMKYGTKSRRGRCVFEVVNQKVGPDARRVGGQNQAAGLRAGFNTFWHSKKDLGRMYKLAVEYTLMRKRFRDPFEDARGKFIVVVGKKCLGTYSRLSKAKYVLMKAISTKSKQGRCIFQVRRGKVMPDPRVIAGQAQMNGMNAGFNRFWWGISDIRAMYRIAAQYNARG